MKTNWGDVLAGMVLGFMAGGFFFYGYFLNQEPVEVVREVEKPLIVIDGQECSLVRTRDMVSGEYGISLRWVETRDTVEVLLECPNQLFFHYVPAE